MSHRNTIERIISEFDLSSEVEKKKAYQKCIEYADNNLVKSLDYSSFISAAAEILGQQFVNRSHIKYMVEKNGNERIHLTYIEDNGPTLTGNKEGLMYLSRLFVLLSNSSFYSEHVHLYYGEYPLYYNSYPLTIYLEDDNWFENLVNKHNTDTKDENENEFTLRDVDYYQVRALCITSEVPPTVLFSKNKLYKVLSVRKYKDEDFMIKKIREDSDRLFIFTLINDDDIQEDFIFDLDDPEILYFTQSDISQFSKD